ncbi:MAG: hypothetical protein ACK4RV_02220 [Caulobacter sp.]
MRVSPFRLEDFAELNLQPAQAEWIDQMTPAAGRALEMNGLTWTARDERGVVGIGGVQAQAPGRGLAWSLLSRDAGRALVPLTRVVRRYFDTSPFRRIEAVTACEFEPARRWAIMLGFRSEGVMTAYFPDGADAERWSRVNVRV